MSTLLFIEANFTVLSATSDTLHSLCSSSRTSPGNLSSDPMSIYPGTAPTSHSTSRKV
jgi:hypothetical protein